MGSLCTSQWRRRYVLNETPNDVSMERRQDVSVVRLYDIWNVITTSQKDVTMAPHQYVSTTSQTILKWNTQRRLDGTSPKRFSVASPWHLTGTSHRRLKRTYQRRPIITSPRRLKQVLYETPNDVSVARYQDVSVVRIHDVPLARLYNVSCKSQIKHTKKLLLYFSTTPRSYIFATSC